MTYEILISQEARADLHKLSSELKIRIKRKLKSLQENPHRYLKWIKQFSLYRLRVGDYRVFIQLEEKTKIITIVTVLHRRVAYSR